MANFDLLKIAQIEDSELDSAVKSQSSNGLVKTRKRFTRIRKTFTITATIATQEERDEIYNLFQGVRTISSFVFDHPTEVDGGLNPIQYTVRFKENLKITQLGNKNGFYEIAPFVLEEV